MQFDSDGESLPALQSVSNSSDESDGGGDNTDNVFSLLNRGTIPRFNTVVGQGERVVINLDDSDDSDNGDMEIAPLSLLHPLSPSPNPSTHPDSDSEITPGATELHETPEPPFLTDGRGRVVWSSMRPPAPTTTYSSPAAPIPLPAPIPRNTKRRAPLSSSSPTTGFTTDGRGRVIGTASPQTVPVPDDSNPSTDEQVDNERLDAIVLAMDNQ